MRLTELNPNWCGHGGEGSFTRGDDGELIPIPERTRVGLTYDCPCGCGDRRYVPFRNPVDGQGPLKSENPNWERTGDDFETLTLKPSIQHVPVKGVLDGKSFTDGCNWHGFITNGEVKTV